MDLHALAEERSIAYHRAVADRLRADPALLTKARARIDEWIARNDRSAGYALRWRDKLGEPLDRLLAFLVDPSEEARAMRQATPFAGFIDPRERWRIWREVRKCFEAEHP
jgi:hypothetical protein